MAGFVLDDRQRLDWLSLIRSESIGPRTFRTLVNRFGGAAGALDALPELGRQAGRTLRLCSTAEAEREFEALRRRGAHLIALGEAAYPVPLQAIDSAPPLIAVEGDPDVLNRPCVALVGSRNASAAGLKFTATLARELGEAGFIVVSGWPVVSTRLPIKRVWRAARLPCWRGARRSLSAAEHPTVGTHPRTRCGAE